MWNPFYLNSIGSSDESKQSNSVCCKHNRGFHPIRKGSNSAWLEMSKVAKSNYPLISSKPLWERKEASVSFFLSFPTRGRILIAFHEMCINSSFVNYNQLAKLLTILWTLRWMVDGGGENTPYSYLNWSYNERWENTSRNTFRRWKYSYILIDLMSVEKILQQLLSGSENTRILLLSGSILKESSCLKKWITYKQ